MQPTNLNLSTCTGERLLILRITRPELADSISRELDRRADRTRLQLHHRPRRSPELKLARVA